jgi:hypothetical protein
MHTFATTGILKMTNKFIDENTYFNPPKDYNEILRLTKRLTDEMIGLGLLYRTQPQSGPDDENQRYKLTPEFEQFIDDYIKNIPNRDANLMELLKDKHCLEIIGTPSIDNPYFDKNAHMIINTIFCYICLKESGLAQRHSYSI